ncbi:MAG: fibronectin type III domain-containing protein [Saprospiraceae bacterium]|nr:fibronectin type III domain-containing protein [Saprospiraceae bacterium]
MKLNYFFIVLLLGVFSFTASAQEGPIYQGTVSSVEYVTSLESRPLDLIAPDDTPREAKDKRSIELENAIIAGKDPQTEDDYFVRNKTGLEQSRMMPPASLVFNAYSSNSQPTDPSLAVGPNHVVVVYNTGFTIYDKSGNQLLGQTSPNPAIFPSGGCCDLTVSYDNAADRWVMTFLGSGAQIAVSDGPNPLTAGWYIYTISAIQDYQKLSVWSDGYYITENTGGSNKVWALERSAMLAGNPGAKILGFNLPGLVTSGFFSPQVLNVTDSNLPAAGGATVVYMQDNAWSGVSIDHIKLWTIDVDWVTTSNSSISTAQQINTTPFISVFDNGSFSNLSQPGGGSSIDALQATIMNQAQFRKFATHNSAVFNFVVDTNAGSGELAGIRWFEFRQSGDNQPWSLYQEGTYTAPDGRHAWHASLAMDAAGNIGMGYTSMSGPSTPTTVRVSSYFTGRLASDPLGVMTVAEGLIANGNQNFSGFRYGDYSKIDVDPSNNSSFWFINEYMSSGRKGVVGVFDIVSGPPDTQAPTDPTNLVASNITTSGATLDWNASTDNVGVAFYNIYIDGAPVGTSATPTFNVTGLAPSTLYTATVNAQDAAGNTSGFATTTFTTLAGIDTQAPTTPTNLVASNPTSSTIDLDWNASTDNVGVVGYEIIMTGGVIYGTVPGNSATITGLAPNTFYKFKVRAFDAAGNYSGLSNLASETTTGGSDTQAPTTPTNLTATNPSSSTIDLNWNASTDNVGVTGYEIFVDGSSYGTVGATTSTTVTGLSANTTYAFNVLAFDAAGNNSGMSNTANETTTGGGGGTGQIAAYYFETGIDGWIDGGSDCVWGFSPGAYEGQGCIRLRDDSNTSNAISPVLDLSGNNEVTFEFHYYPRSMEAGEDFFVEFFNGSTYEVIGQYVSGVDFNNNSFYSPPLIVLDAGTYNFNANNRFRIRCDASANNDQIFFDQVIISGDNVAPLAPASPVVENPNTEILKSFIESTEENIKIYPNPANSELTIEMKENNYDEIVIFSSSGQKVYIAEKGVEKITINVSQFTPGMYFVRFIANGIATTQRFIKQ